MKIKKEFILKKLNENTENEMTIVIAVGKYAKNISGYIKLNETSEFLWNMLKDGATKEELINGLLSEYDVTKEIASKDVEAVIETLKKIGAIDE